MTDSVGLGRNLGGFTITPWTFRPGRKFLAALDFPAAELAPLPQRRDLQMTVNLTFEEAVFGVGRDSVRILQPLR
jgi:hypothetical protein